MSGFNVQRVLLGEFVAGLVANAFDFVITSYLMAAEFAAMLARLNVGESAAQSWIWVFAAHARVVREELGAVPLIRSRVEPCRRGTV
jgi:hypothetical protein